MESKRTPQTRPRSMVTWCLIAEASFDAEVATILIDRIIVSEIDWTDSIVRSLRSFVGLPTREERLRLEPDDALGTESFSTWKDVKQVADDLNIRVYGTFGGHGGAARRIMKKLRALDLRLKLHVDAFVLLWDTDGHEERREQFHTEAGQPTEQAAPICVGTPHPEIEAWVLHGFDCLTQDEERLLIRERSALGFDPRADAHRLNPK